MSKKRPTESSWDSDEELLSDTSGITAFPKTTELDLVGDDGELDEDALLGMDDSGAKAVSVSFTNDSMRPLAARQRSATSVTHQEQAFVFEETDTADLEDELNAGVQDADSSAYHAGANDGYSYDQGGDADAADGAYTEGLDGETDGGMVYMESHEGETDYNDESQGDYGDGTNQGGYMAEQGSGAHTGIELGYEQPEEQEDQVHLEYGESGDQHDVSESGQEPKESEHYESESDSDEDSSRHGRGKFTSERTGVISLAVATARETIPDTLEINEEQAAQIEQFMTDKSQRGKGKARGQGRQSAHSRLGKKGTGPQQPGLLQGPRQGGPLPAMLAQRLRMGFPFPGGPQLGGPFPGRMMGPRGPFPVRMTNHGPFPGGPMNQRGPFPGGPEAHRGPFPRGGPGGPQRGPFPDRFPGPRGNFPGGPPMAQHGMRGPPLGSPQMQGPPASQQMRQQGPFPQRGPQPGVRVSMAGMGPRGPRPLIGPGEAGMRPGGPGRGMPPQMLGPQSQQIPSLLHPGQGPPQRPGQPGPQAGPRRIPPHQRLGPVQGRNQPRMIMRPPGPGGPLMGPPGPAQPLMGGQAGDQGMRKHKIYINPRFQGPQTAATGVTRTVKLGVPVQQKKAKALLDKAKQSKQTAPTQVTTASVAVKRKSSGGDDPPTKVIKAEPESTRVVEKAEPAGPEDAESRRLKALLEEQRKKREMIQKRKELARQKQAAVKRQELEKRLKEEGKSIEDIVGSSEAESIAAPEKEALPSTNKKPLSGSVAARLGPPPTQQQAGPPAQIPQVVRLSSAPARLGPAPPRPQQFQGPPPQFQNIQTRAPVPNSQFPGGPRVTGPQVVQMRGPHPTIRGPPPGTDPRFRGPPPTHDPRLRAPPPSNDPRFRAPPPTLRGPPPGTDPRLRGPPPSGDPRLRGPPPGSDPRLRGPAPTADPRFQGAPRNVQYGAPPPRPETRFRAPPPGQPNHTDPRLRAPPPTANPRFGGPQLRPAGQPVRYNVPPPSGPQLVRPQTAPVHAPPPHHYPGSYPPTSAPPPASTHHYPPPNQTQSAPYTPPATQYPPQSPTYPPAPSQSYQHQTPAPQPPPPSQHYPPAPAPHYQQPPTPQYHAPSTASHYQAPHPAPAASSYQAPPTSQYQHPSPHYPSSTTVYQPPSSVTYQGSTAHYTHPTTPAYQAPSTSQYPQPTDSHYENVSHTYTTPSGQQYRHYDYYEEPQPIQTIVHQTPAPAPTHDQRTVEQQKQEGQRIQTIGQRVQPVTNSQMRSIIHNVVSPTASANPSRHVQSRSPGAATAKIANDGQVRVLDGPQKILIQNVPQVATKETLIKICRHFGQVLGVTLMREQSKAVVQFQKGEQAAKCVAKCDQKCLHKTRLTVKLLPS